MSTSRPTVGIILAEIVARIAEREAVLASGVGGRWASELRFGIQQDRAAYAAIMASTSRAA